jgi:hypothetical protein
MRPANVRGFAAIFTIAILISRACVVAQGSGGGAGDRVIPQRQAVISVEAHWRPLGRRASSAAQKLVDPNAVAREYHEAAA